MTEEHPPAEVEIRIRHRGRSITVTRTQKVDRLGRPSETLAETVKGAVADVQPWVRRPA